MLVSPAPPVPDGPPGLRPPSFWVEQSLTNSLPFVSTSAYLFDFDLSGFLVFPEEEEGQGERPGLGSVAWGE